MPDYRALDREGGIHELRGADPGLTHCVVIRSSYESPLANWAGSSYIASRIEESVMREGKTAEIIPVTEVS